MLIISDVHAAFDALARVVQGGEPVLVLGDLVNFVDYRTGAGIALDLFGDAFVTDVRRLRAANDFDGSRRLWRAAADARQIDIRQAVSAHIEEQYRACELALGGGEVYLIHGNVDTPSLLRSHLPAGASYVHGQVLDIDGWSVGFAGGGAETPLGTPGEITDAEMEEVLAGIGPVDVLCTHVPPAIGPLSYDTIAGHEQRSSQPILRFLEKHQPRYHFFGDVHQPRGHVGDRVHPLPQRRVLPGDRSRLSVDANQANRHVDARTTLGPTNPSKGHRMAEGTVQSIEIAADPATIYAIAADLDAYPDWAEGVQSVSVTEANPDGLPKRAEFVVDAMMKKIKYVLEYDHDAPNLMSWSAVPGADIKMMQGSYEFTAHEGGATSVVYALKVDPAFPVPGFIRRQAEKTLVNIALRGLKKRAEEAVEAE